MLVKYVMTSPVICIDCKKTISDAIEIMKDKNIGFLPITKNDALVGVITDRDILLRGKDKRATTQIEKIMTKDNIKTLEIDNTLEDAGRIMSTYKIRRLIVVEDNLIKGIITSKHLLYQNDLISYIKQTYLNI